MDVRSKELNEENVFAIDDTVLAGRVNRKHLMPTCQSHPHDPGRVGTNGSMVAAKGSVLGVGIYGAVLAPPPEEGLRWELGLRVLPPASRQPSIAFCAAASASCLCFPFSKFAIRHCAFLCRLVFRQEHVFFCGVADGSGVDVCSLLLFTEHFYSNPYKM